MNYLLSKWFLSVNRNPAVLVIGEGSGDAGRVIRKILSSSPQKGSGRLGLNKVLPIFSNIFESAGKTGVFTNALKNSKDLKTLLTISKASSKLAVVLCGISIKNDFGGMASIESDLLYSFVRSLTNGSFLIYNSDNVFSKRIGTECTLGSKMSYGFGPGADMAATDVTTGDKTNFKVSHKGNVVPVWLEKKAGTKEVYAVLAGMAVGRVFDRNLVEAAQAVRNYLS